MTFALLCIYLLAGALVARVVYSIDNLRGHRSQTETLVVFFLVWPLAVPVALLVPRLFKHMILPVARYFCRLADRLAAAIDNRLDIGMDP